MMDMLFFVVSSLHTFCNNTRMPNYISYSFSFFPYNNILRISSKEYKHLSRVPGHREIKKRVSSVSPQAVRNCLQTPGE